VSYGVEIQTAALRDLQRLPPDVRKAVAACIEALAENPRPPGVRPLTEGLKGLYRVRVRRDYRVGYEVDDRARIVTTWQVGHRSKFHEKGKRLRK
jgi:mRNA interferase RelE/StbE